MMNHKSLGKGRKRCTDARSAGACYLEVLFAEEVVGGRVGRRGRRQLHERHGRRLRAALDDAVHSDKEN